MSMPRTRSFMQVDVFSTSPYSGNPVAVVLDGTDLSDEEMQGLARWTNLSETTFVLPPTVPEADYRLRIFTPGGELPFAGHPTLGSARAWLDGGGTPRDDERIVQECGAGLVAVRRGEGTLAFAAPPRVREGRSTRINCCGSWTRSGSRGTGSWRISGSTTGPGGPWCGWPRPRRCSPSNLTSPPSRTRWSVRSGPVRRGLGTRSRCVPSPPPMRRARGPRVREHERRMSGSGSPRPVARPPPTGSRRARGWGGPRVSRSAPMRTAPYGSVAPPSCVFAGPSRSDRHGAPVSVSAVSVFIVT